MIWALITIAWIIISVMMFMALTFCYSEYKNDKFYNVVHSEEFSVNIVGVASVLFPIGVIFILGYFPYRAVNRFLSKINIFGILLRKLTNHKYLLDRISNEI